MNKSAFISELLRKSIHLVGPILIIVGYTLLLTYFGSRAAILVITALLLILIEIEHVRIEHKPKIAKAFDSLFRAHEKDNVSGAVFIVISCIICFSAFEYWIASLALFMTVFGDIFAAIIGKAFGKSKLYKNKTVLGSLAGLSANLIVGVLMLPGFYLLIVPMALTATFVEIISSKIHHQILYRENLL